jgi:hypothetical protein
MALRSTKMASERAIYWMAVAVLAVFLGNHFVSKHEGGCTADRAVAAVQRLSGEAAHFLAMGQAMLGHGSRFASSEVAMARVQGQFASIEDGFARQEAACARSQARHARVMALQQMERARIRVICPRTSVNVEIPQMPAVHDGTI